MSKTPNKVQSTTSNNASAALGTAQQAKVKKAPTKSRRGKGSSNRKKTPPDAEIQSLDQTPVVVVSGGNPTSFIINGKFLEAPGLFIWAIDAKGNHVEQIEFGLTEKPLPSEMAVYAKARAGTSPGLYRISIGRWPPVGPATSKKHIGVPRAQATFPEYPQDPNDPDSPGIRVV